MSLRVCQRVAWAVLAAAVLSSGCGGGGGEVVVVGDAPGQAPSFDGGGLGGVGPLSQGAPDPTSAVPEASAAARPGAADAPAEQPRSAVRPSSTPEAAAESQAPAPEQTAVPQAGHTPDTELSAPGSEAPEDEPTTGVPDRGGEGGPEAGGLGGLVLYPYEEPGPLAQVAERIYDLCDDLEALAAQTGRFLGPGEEITFLDRLQIDILRSADEVDCDTPGSNRYSYVTEHGRTGARPTAAEAQAIYDATQVGYEKRIKTSPPGLLLGYLGTFRREFPLTERDEIAVLRDTITVKDGVVRGLVHNLSETLYARDLAVTARDPQLGSASDGVAGTWRWPFTLQPGERAPFEIAGWAGPSDPGAVSIEVTAATSTDPDYKRAFGIGSMEFNPARPADYRRFVPPYARKDGPLPDGGFAFRRVDGLLMVPDSPPEAADEMFGIEIENPRIIFALLDNDNRVVDVVERVPYADFDTGHMRVDRLPAWYDDPLHGDRIPVIRMSAAIITTGPGWAYRWQVWMGGANPAPTQQQTDRTTE